MNFPGLTKVDTPPIEAYENLANAIISSAADDYRKALRHSDSGLRDNVESFFRSGLFEVLTNLDPEELMRRLREEYQKGRRKSARV